MRYYKQHNRYPQYSQSSNDAIQHVIAAQKLEAELGESLAVVKEYFFSLNGEKLNVLFNIYQNQYGYKAREYAELTLDDWRNGSVKMSGLVAERLFKILPSIMQLPEKYELVSLLWKHLKGTSKLSYYVGDNVTSIQLLKRIQDDLSCDLGDRKTTPELEKRFDWLAQGDARVKQQLLEHFMNTKKTLLLQKLKNQLSIFEKYSQENSVTNLIERKHQFKFSGGDISIEFDASVDGITTIKRYKSSVSDTDLFNLIFWLIIACLFIFIKAC